MKRLALLGVIAVMLASTVFAPVAVAQELGEVDIQSVTQGPEGSIVVTGTIQCEAPRETGSLQYNIEVFARQAQGNNKPVTNGYGSTFGKCLTDGPQSFTVEVVPNSGDRPFKKGDVLLTGSGQLCTDFECYPQQPFRELIRVR